MSFVFETELLKLVPMTPQYREDVFRYRSDKHANKYQGWIPNEISDVDDFMSNLAPEFDTPDTWFQLLILEKKSANVIGDIGVHFVGADNQQVELGCTIGKEYQRQGYAVQALSALIDHLFLELHKHRIFTSLDPRNSGSVALVKRLGFKKEAHHKESYWFNGAWADDLIYAMLKSEWVQKRTVLENPSEKKRPQNKVFIAQSIDGYIADKNGKLDWLQEIPNPDGIDMGYPGFMNRIDAIVMGRNTFETVLGFDIDWPYLKKVFVLSNTLRVIPDELVGKVEILSGKLEEILPMLKEQGYNNLYIDGGKTIQSFLNEDLIDEMVITTMPILLGGGSPLFGNLNHALRFQLIESETFLNSITQSKYIRKR